MADTNKKKYDRKSVGLAVGLLCALLAALILLGCLALYSISSKDRAVSEPAATEAPVETVLPVNGREKSDFSAEDGRITYPGAVAGIDVSEHQREIDWNAVAEDNIGFAIVRLGRRGSTEGKLFTDDCFAANVDGAAAAGLDVGVYFYSQAISVEEAEAEADYVISELAGRKLTLPVFFDWERGSNPDRVLNTSMLQVTEYAAAFCARIEQAGYRAGVYFNQRDGYSMRLRLLKDYAFWLAEYSSAMDYYYDVSFWQYSYTGSVAGIQTAVDLNLRFS